MVHKKQLPKLFGVVVIISLLFFVFLKLCLLWQPCYSNNRSFDKSTNYAIKRVVLEAMKDSHSDIFAVNQQDIYTSAYLAEYAQDAREQTPRSPFVIIDSSFMKSLKRISEDEYAIEVQLKWPDDWKYDIEIQNKEYINTVQKVLVEGPSKNNKDMLTGRTENNKVVIFEGKKDFINKILNIKLIEDHMWYFKGEII